LFEVEKFLLDTGSSEDLHLVPTYQKFPITIVRGEGALLFDDSGRQYIDLSGGYGVAIVGHANALVAEAIASQSRKLITCHGSMYNDAREGYLSELVKYLPSSLQRIFLCNSGAEANEAAMKFARLYTGRTEIVAFTGSFHGKTQGALSATWNPKYRKSLDELLTGTTFCQFGSVERAREAISESTAAVLVEPIQGESGIHVASETFLKELREITRQHRALLIFDEVQCGFGRTGKMWAYEHSEVEPPDILVAAKGIGGGFPLGFAAVTEEVSSALKPGAHTSTFGGNPLACAAGLAALQFLVRGNIVEKARTDGIYFMDKLEKIAKKHPRLVREVRGKGMMIGIELKVPVKDLIMKGFDSGLISLYSGLNIVRLLPPLVITRDQIDTVSLKLDAILDSLEASRSVSKSASEPEIRVR
jgi:acetylornithine/LysW-gamma-L-lysine aminotransferase